MRYERSTPGAGVAWGLLLLLGSWSPIEAQFPDVTASELALDAFPGEPRAPAIEIYRKGELQLMDPSRQRMSSLLRVERRVKILTEEGRDEFSDFAIRHSRFLRLTDLEGRTVQPDGSTVALDASSIFQETVSEKSKWYITKAAFPAVQIGSILDLSYSLRFESIFHLEPWDFQGTIPSLHSEIQYYIPETLAMAIWERVTLPGGRIGSESDRDGQGRRLRFWMDNVASVPQEPLSFPLEDLTTRFMLYPARIGFSGEFIPLFESWETTAGFFGDDYKLALKRSSKTRKQAKKMTASLASPDAKARALYDFVRDDVANEFYPFVWIDQQHSIDETLQLAEGDSVEKALLLLAMLRAVGISSDIVWTAYRSDGMVDTRLATPYAFDNVVLRAQIDGETVWLDPSEPTLPFGHLHAENEGMLGLLVADKVKDSQLIRLPVAPVGRHQETVDLDLEIDASGTLRGKVEVTYAGHAFTERAMLDATADDIRDTWTSRAEQAFGLQVVSIQVSHDTAAGTMQILLDVQEETSLAPAELSVPLARPHGPLTNVLLQPAEERVTPVLLEPGSRQALSLKLSWSEEWALDLEPESSTEINAAGKFIATVSLDEENRSLVYGRLFERTQREFLDPTQYDAVRNLFRAAEDHDSQFLVLVRE